MDKQLLPTKYIRTQSVHINLLKDSSYMYVIHTYCMQFAGASERYIYIQTPFDKRYIAWFVKTVQFSLSSSLFYRLSFRALRYIHTLFVFASLLVCAL